MWNDFSRTFQHSDPALTRQSITAVLSSEIFIASLAILSHVPFLPVAAKQKEKEEVSKGKEQWRDKRKIQPRVVPARPLLPLLPPSHCPRPSLPGVRHYASESGNSRPPLSPSRFPNRGDPLVSPAARLPYILPQPPDPRDPCSTSGEEVGSRLWLAAAALPILARVGLAYLAVEVLGPYRRVPRQEPIAACKGLLRRWRCSRRRPLTGWGLYRRSGPAWLGDPLGGRTEPGLGGHVERLGKASSATP